MKKIPDMKTDTGTLFIVATPIGNLEDVTVRAARTLREAAYILAEDTRVTQKLLNHLGAKQKLFRCDEYAGETLFARTLEDLSAGKSVAFVSDAGTPGIADPAAKLVRYVSERAPEIAITPVPGPSAVPALLSVAGIHANRFLFLGYPPHKKGRETFFREAKENPVRPVVMFESPHRILKTLEQIEKHFGAEAELVVGRELTKLHEEIFRGTVRAAGSHFSANPKGEFAVAIL
jgi:16S rRNA (cytidine1402-2'-O)-methyltransferase